MMQKNEDELLLPWANYHGKLFGYDNLYIFDNGSTIEGISEKLEHLETLGVTIDRSKSAQGDFETKGDIIAAKIKELNEKQKIDFSFPLDCDEFVGVEEDLTAPSFDAPRIFEELSKYAGSKRALMIKKGYDNHPADPTLFRRTSSVSKTFFASDSCESLDIGFHNGIAKGNAGRTTTNLIYVHYHCKPYDRAIAQTKQKLLARIEGFDRASLLDYVENRKPGHHLVKILLYKDETEYLESFANGNFIYLEPFVKKMDAYGIQLPYAD